MNLSKQPRALFVSAMLAFGVLGLGVFALLAAATLDGLPSNVPRATGARRPVVLGSITPRP